MIRVPPASPSSFPAPPPPPRGETGAPVSPLGEGRETRIESSASFFHLSVSSPHCASVYSVKGADHFLLPGSGFPHLASIAPASQLPLPQSLSNPLGPYGTTPPPLGQTRGWTSGGPIPGVGGSKGSVACNICPESLGVGGRQLLSTECVSSPGGRTWRGRCRQHFLFPVTGSSAGNTCDPGGCLLGWVGAGTSFHSR